MYSNQLSFEKSLLAVLEDQIGVITRRINKSGVNYYAISRFDAVKEILEEDFSSLITASQVHAELETYVRQMLQINDALSALSKNYPELSSSTYRTDRIIRRSELLLDEIRTAAHNTDPNKASYPLGEAENAVDRAEFEDIWNDIKNS